MQTKHAHELLQAAENDAAFLDKLANILDGWARDSREGGWSTHQVRDNMIMADDCRRRASQIRSRINKIQGKTP